MSGNDDKIESGYVGVQDPDVLVNLEPAKPYQVKSPLLRECIAEFLGTMVMIMFGDGVVAQVVLSEGTKGDCHESGDLRVLKRGILAFSVAPTAAFVNVWDPCESSRSDALS
ncbi:hypothetical protein PF002_g4032 [Phytophthora fragariae]|uniref:Aquaporin n=1 Tax=Phytophthora fragariae TaxID=53985 RepID=A0A6A4A579_9STRA|nr:hypothetical protein PF002_g4032 [Phytophthora fragariae]